MNKDFQSIGRGLRKPMGIIQMRSAPDLDQQLEKLRAEWNKHFHSTLPAIMEENPCKGIDIGEALDALTHSIYRRTYARNEVVDPGLPPECSITHVSPLEPIKFIVTSVSIGDGQGPKCECGKDKHGFAAHMQFCPKWEPVT